VSDPKDPPPLDATMSVAAARGLLTRRFAARAGEEASLDARILIEAATGRSHAALIADPDAPLGDAAERLAAMARRRLAGEPTSRILGWREFWSMRFRVTPDTLDPRPDTETLIETACDAFAARRDEALRIVDFGTGTGAILAALLCEFPRATGVAVDLSPAAAAVARDNLQRLGFADRARVAVANWDEGLEGRFDLIASNPPYIPAADIAGLAPEVRDHDPRLALEGGADGLDAYRALARIAARRLSPGGLALFEVGAGQAEAVLALCAEAGLVPRGARRDLAGHARVTAAAAAEKNPGFEHSDPAKTLGAAAKTD
jgi:release factor glutamine methyltransferase